MLDLNSYIFHGTDVESKDEDWASQINQAILDGNQIINLSLG